MCAKVLTVKIAVRETSEGGAREKMAKCRRKRGVTGLRPPPGGAHAAQIVTSYTQKRTALKPDPL